MEGHNGAFYDGCCISRKTGSGDIIGSDKPIPFEPKPESMHAELFGQPPYQSVLISWPAMEASALFDGEAIKPYFFYDSTKDAFDIARNDFVQEKDDMERKKNVLYCLVVFDDSLKVDVLDKERTTEIQMEVVTASTCHDRFNPRPLPELTRNVKDSVTGQDVTDASGNVVTERVVIVAKEGISQVYWRVAIDRKGAMKGAIKMPKIKTPAELARERALLAASNANVTGLENLDIS